MCNSRFIRNRKQKADSALSKLSYSIYVREIHKKQQQQQSEKKKLTSEKYTPAKQHHTHPTNRYLNQSREQYYIKKRLSNEIMFESSAIV